ncbi:MAG: hypothetical protein U9O41_02965 [Candidatus Aerophobetes bacterium]|nr:hypothetical protein [Candidatus Aerophobetes bacterium]
MTSLERAIAVIKGKIPDRVLAGDTPLKNIHALVNSAKKYGVYTNNT